jgi:hypothetical protein
VQRQTQLPLTKRCIRCSVVVYSAPDDDADASDTSRIAAAVAVVAVAVHSRHACTSYEEVRA